MELLKAADAPRGFRWLHFNLADQGTLRWLNAVGAVSHRVSQVFMSPDWAQKGLVDGEAMGLVQQDLELDSFGGEPGGSALLIAVGPSMIVTGRHYPLRSAEAMKQRIDAGARIKDVVGALALIFAALPDVYRSVNSDLDAQAQVIEDELQKDRPTPDARTFINILSLMVRMHRLFSGARALFRRLEDEGEALQACLVAVRRPALDHRRRPPSHPEPDTASAR